MEPFKLQSEGVFPPKARLSLESQSFETTFADYEYFEAYEQEPEYSPELYEATLSRDCRENKTMLNRKISVTNSKKETLA